MRIEGTNPNRGKPVRPILRSEIEEAQRNSNSNMSAARYLKVDYKRYRKYAKLYGMFETHMNQTGVGTAKGRGKYAIPLSKIFNNEYPKYNINRLKYRLIARGILEEKCCMCGFNERRITDGKIPILLTFKNGIRDFNKDNLILLCYNCMFLTSGAPVVAHRSHIEVSFNPPTTMNFPKEQGDNVLNEPDDDYDVSELDLETLQNEILDELENQ